MGLGVMIKGHTVSEFDLSFFIFTAGINIKGPTVNPLL